MTNLTDADAPFVAVRPTKLIVTASGHHLLWLDQNNEIKADSFHLTSSNGQTQVTFIQTGGTAHAGDTVGVRLNISGVNHDYTYVVQSGDTLLTINAALIALMDADTTNLANNNIFGFFAVNNVSTTYWYIMGPWDKIPTVTNISTGGHTTFTITPSNGTLDSDGCQINWQRVIPGRTPMVGDYLHCMGWNGQTLGSGNGVGAVYANLVTVILDPSDTHPLGRFNIQTQAGNAQFDEGGVNLTYPGNSLKLNGLSIYGDEEGTWTPALRGRTTAGTPDYTGGGVSGTYVKRGRWVEVVGFVKGSLSGSAGDVIFSGLPYPVREIQSVGTIGYFAGVTLGAGYTALGMMGDINASTIALFKSGGASAVALQTSEIATINTRFAMRYKTD